MTHTGLSTRVGMAAVTLGFLLAGPHVTGVAVADTDSGSTSAKPGPQRGHPRPGSQSPAAAPTPPASAAASGRTTRTAEPSTPTAGPNLQLPQRGVGRYGRATLTARADPSPPVTGSASQRPLSPSVAPQATATLPADTGHLLAPNASKASAPLAQSVATAERTADTPAPAAAVGSPAAGLVPVVTAPAAGATTAPAVAGSVGSIRNAVANVIDSSLNWLDGLPGGPVAELMSGALMLVRRSLEDAAATIAPQRVAATTSQVANTFVVTTLADAGPGSLRQAIIDANTTPGADAITFGVAGTIKIGKTALPAITDTTVIDGTTAPGYTHKPVVRVDFQNTQGLVLGGTADDSQILGLSLVDAAVAGVTIAASDTTLTGNYIGVREDGRTVEANRGDGVLLTTGADGNVIGNLSPWNFVLANVISGNQGNGITIAGGTGNTIAANYIGTDDTGTRALGNRGSGIELTLLAAGNLIGGMESAGNNPTQGTFVRPPQGNLISGNQGNGVLIDDGATGNQLSGNFIGTNASGNAALGNLGDGVAMINADGNRLIGTTSLQDPFVFYNVISGNRGNGLRVTNSDRTVVHANFFGIGADNRTIVANWGDGMLVNGDSQSVDAGGEMPLGNVMSGNIRYGIEIADISSGVVSFNNFVGQAALGTQPRPNRMGGIRVTSSNPSFDRSNESSWNRVRNSVVGGNWGNGIEFLGNAHGAEVTATSVGTDNTVKKALANLGNGIVVGGNSSQIAIGGFEPSVEELAGGFSVYSGASRGFGIVFKDNAHDSSVYNTRVGLGTGITTDTAAKIPNQLGGILVGRGPSNITIGGLRDALTPGLPYGNEIVGNQGNGLLAVSTKGLKVLGSIISGNRASGVVLNGARDAVIGEPLAGNTIDGNRAYGIFGIGDLGTSRAQSSAILGNGLTGVRMSWARGINIGGPRALEPNIIAENQAWGIWVTGWSRGSALSGNIVTKNASGDVNTTWSIGLLEIPPP